MTTVHSDCDLREPHCSTRGCKHWEGVLQPDGTEATEVPWCLAYPNGIPFRIAYAHSAEADLHLEVNPDQETSIVFEEEGRDA
jgi:hypothetical protein